MLKAKIIWFTGMSGAGKSTITNKLYYILNGKGYKVKVIDGDHYRNNNNLKDFTKTSIINNNYEIINLCKTLLVQYNYILVAVIAPFEVTRREARYTFKQAYIEIYISATLKTLIGRDTKGLYKKAIDGKLDNLIGFDSSVPYEKPQNPEIIVDTTKMNLNKSLKKILSYLKEN
jgi:adenylyl-sulfate kinase